MHVSLWKWMYRQSKIVYSVNEAIALSLEGMHLKKKYIYPPDWEVKVSPVCIYITHIYIKCGQLASILLLES